MSKFSGLNKIEYSVDVSGSFASPTSLLEGLADGSFSPEIPTVETGDGRQLYAGKKGNVEHNIYDLSLFAALETIMKDDTPIAVRYTFMDDTTEIVINNGLCQVKKNYSPTVGSRNSFNFKSQEYTT